MDLAIGKGAGVALTAGMLAVSNLLMTFAWYWHLRSGAGAGHMPLIWVILLSWGIAFFEYVVAVPANRIGASAGMNVAQLKIMQEVITVGVFIPFMMLYMGEKWRWDYLWAMLCMVGAVYFVNRGRM